MLRKAATEEGKDWDKLCVDYRRLNSVSKTDAYPMPRIDDMIDQLGSASFIFTLDLTRGYWQVPVFDNDRYKTAFWAVWKSLTVIS